MKLQIVAIRDRAINAYMRPFFAQSTGQAIRMFQDEVNNKEGEIHKHPDDYDLYHLGEWNDEGIITPIPPHQLALGKELKQT